MADYTKAQLDQMYSDAYDNGASGQPMPDTTRLEGEAKAATEYGWERGKKIADECNQANRYDPSGAYLTRSTIKSMKWKFPGERRGT
jgi:hypothetical protein